MSNDRSLLADLFAAGDAGDFDSFGRFLHDDVVVHAPAGLSTTGLGSERDSWRRGKAAMPNIRHQFVDLIESGSTIAARVVVTGTMQGEYGELSSEGRAFTVDQALFAHVRDGKIGELWEIVDTASLEQQLSSSGAQPSRSG